MLLRGLQFTVPAKLRCWLLHCAVHCVYHLHLMQVCTCSLASSTLAIHLKQRAPVSSSLLLKQLQLCSSLLLVYVPFPARHRYYYQMFCSLPGIACSCLQVLSSHALQSTVSQTAATTALICRRTRHPTSGPPGTHEMCMAQLCSAVNIIVINIP
jgi:hypothetical protein